MDCVLMLGLMEGHTASLQEQSMEEPDSTVHLSSLGGKHFYYEKLFM